LAGGVSLFFVVGLFCAGLVFDLWGWRSRWTESGDPDDRIRNARRVAILGIGWVGLLSALCVVCGVGIHVLIER
jgi:uncharacterized membrane protein